MCVFVSRPMKIVTFLRKHGETAKRVVDFPRERDTFRNKIMEIVKDFASESNFSFFFIFSFFHFSSFFISHVKINFWAHLGWYPFGPSFLFFLLFSSPVFFSFFLLFFSFFLIF